MHLNVVIDVDDDNTAAKLDFVPTATGAGVIGFNWHGRLAQLGLRNVPVRGSWLLRYF